MGQLRRADRLVLRGVSDVLEERDPFDEEFDILLKALNDELESELKSE